MSGAEIIKLFGGENIKGYSLVNNYGYTFDKDDRRWDARFWANCYGASPMVWSIMGFRKDGEQYAPKKPEWAKALEDKLNSEDCSERS